jgi:hypothetical protein
MFVSPAVAAKSEIEFVLAVADAAKSEIEFVLAVEQ